MSRTITFETAVDRGRKAVLTMGKASWTLGDIAANVEAKYGDDTIAKLAEALFVNPTTLDSYRKAARTYPADLVIDGVKIRETGNGFTVYSIFASQDDATDLVAEKIWTVSEARDLVKSRKDGNGNNASNGDGDDDSNDNGSEPELTLDEQIANAEAEVKRLRGQLSEAEAALTKLQTKKAAAERKASNRSKNGAPRTSRTRVSDTVTAASVRAKYGKTAA